MIAPGTAADLAQIARTVRRSRLAQDLSIAEAAAASGLGVDVWEALERERHPVRLTADAYQAAARALVGEPSCLADLLCSLAGYEPRPRPLVA